MRLPLTARFKRCPKCRAMLRTSAEICPHCGLNMPISFPYNPVIPGQTARVLREMNEPVVPEVQSRAAIAARYLILVARDREDLLTYLRRQFNGEVGVEVRLERRVAERRRRDTVKPLDRRRRDRRAKPPLDAELRKFGFAIVRLD
jgi:predicted amidophosphoribosyltransferase